MSWREIDLEDLQPFGISPFLVWKVACIKTTVHRLPNRKSAKKQNF